MKTTLLLARISLCAAAARLAVGAATLHVAPPPAGSDTNPGTIDQPFASVQKGIDVAAEGDTVVVAQGTYVETLQFKGRNLILRSTDPLDAQAVSLTVIEGDPSGPVVRFAGKNIVLTSTGATNPGAIARTILDGGGRAPVVTFAGTEGSSCIFSGFTIQNGQGDEAGGVFGQGTGATMSSLVVRSNTAVFWGGGLSGCNGRIQNTLLTGNSAREGSALFRCDGEIRNCTITGNSAEWYGAVHQCHATLRNSIIWGNSTTEGGASIAPALPTYSCIEGWTDGGTGNLAQDPQFVNAASSDYRLRPSSPCLDTGDNTVLNLPATDLAGGHRLIYGGRSVAIDMGAFEHCIHACAFEPAANTTTLTWSSLSGRGYSILWSQDLHDWLPAVQVPSAGNTTTSWMDDGSRTGGPPPQSPHRFYRIQELP